MKTIRQREALAAARAGMQDAMAASPLPGMCGRVDLEASQHVAVRAWMVHDGSRWAGCMRLPVQLHSVALQGAVRRLVHEFIRDARTSVLPPHDMLGRAREVAMGVAEDHGLRPLATQASWTAAHTPGDGDRMLVTVGTRDCPGLGMAVMTPAELAQPGWEAHLRRRLSSQLTTWGW